MADLRHHNNYGFGFIEVMLALFIMGTLLSAVISLSQSSISSLFDYSGRLQRIFLLEETLFDITYAQLQHKPIKEREKPNEELPTKISYRKLPISDKSALKAFKDDLDMYQVKAEWSSLYRNHEETMIGLFLKKTDEKK